MSWRTCWMQLPVLTTSSPHCPLWFSVLKSLTHPLIKSYLASHYWNTMGGWFISPHSRGGLGRVFASGSLLFHLCYRHCKILLCYHLTKVRLSGIYEDFLILSEIDVIHPLLFTIFICVDSSLCTILGWKFSVLRFHRLSHSLSQRLQWVTITPVIPNHMHSFCNTLLTLNI